MQSVLNEESIFDTINLVLKNVNKHTNRDNNGKNKSAYYLGGSISRYAKNLTMSFPVLVDDGLSVETAQMISKANEKNIASMLELLFASMSFGGDKGTNGKDILKLIHTNIDSMSADDYIDYANEYIANHEDTQYLPKLSKAELRDLMTEMCAELKKGAKRFPVNSFSERSLNDYLCKDGYSGTRVYEHVVQEDDQLDWDKFTYQQHRDAQRDAENDFQNNRDYELRRGNADRDYDLKSRDHDLRRSQYGHNLKSDADNRHDSWYRDQNNLNQKRILDSDFKKANELQPTLMQVNFNILDNNGSPVDRKSFVAGVKCRMIATSSSDIAERLLSTNKTQTSFKNLIRATTGEIKLGRDFILAVDQQKLDAMNDVKKGEAAKLWSILKKRSTKNTARSISRDKNDATSITTLVISQDTVNYMTSSANFNIANPKNAKLIMDRYNLLCLVIADETNEVAKFLYDGNLEYESVSYLVLGREAKDKEMRKATELLYRGGR